VAVDTPVTIFLARGHERARAVNLSRGGMFVRTELPLPRRSEWRLRFELPDAPDGAGSIAPTAMVVWRADEDDPIGPGLGLRFVELDGASARHLDEYVYERTPSSFGAPPPRP
jgi:uncharacterized protein (TIGR02266 family)